MIENELLLIPDKQDIEIDNLVIAWKEKGGLVKEISKFWIKPNIGNARITIYGNEMFCLVLAQVLGVQLIQVEDEVVADFTKDFLKRDVKIIDVNKVLELEFPIFIKSVKPKLIKAKVFQTKEDLSLILNGLEENERLICSDVVLFEKEIRAFVLDDKIKDLAFYEGEGDLKGGKEFIELFLMKNEIALPKTFVLDIGFSDLNGWMIIELNSSWGAGLNNCSPSKVLDCIREATKQCEK